MGVKERIDVAGMPTSASSRVRRGHRAPRDSAVPALLRRAGAIVLGKTHAHELGYGPITPKTANAQDHIRVADSSSGGSAVAVAAGSATLAVGTDAAGSISVPAALNGVVGFKPTAGLLPLRGIAQLSWSLDHVGQLTRTVEDAALILEAMAGTDSYGQTADVSPVDRPLRNGDMAWLPVDVPRNHFFDEIEPDVELHVRQATESLAALGAELVPIDVPMGDYIAAISFGVMLPEASAYHGPAMFPSSTPRTCGSCWRLGRYCRL